METLIRDALRAGKRDVAKEHALRFEELKRQIEAAKQRVAAAKQAYEAGKRKTSELESAQQQAKLTAPLAAMADQAGVLTAADDMLRKLEQEAALDEARIKLAMGELPPELPSSSPEDILKEFE